MEAFTFYAVLFGIFAVITGSLAARKNRNHLAWGFFGGISPVLVLLVLMFMPFLCPKCKSPVTNAQHNNGECPHCRLESLRTEERVKETFA